MSLINRNKSILNRNKSILNGFGVDLNKGKEVKMSKEEFIDEHKELIDTLKTGSKERQEEELDDILNKDL